jgi:hypothetical protein
MVVIEDPECLDHIGHGDPAIADEWQVLSVRDVGRRRETIGAHVDARRRLVEVDHDELVMHPGAAAHGRFRLDSMA